MKMITLTKLRDALRDFKYEVKVPEDIAQRAPAIPIERMSRSADRLTERAAGPRGRRLPEPRAAPRALRSSSAGV